MDHHRHEQVTRKTESSEQISKSAQDLCSASQLPLSLQRAADRAQATKALESMGVLPKFGDFDSGMTPKDLGQAPKFRDEGMSPPLGDRHTVSPTQHPEHPELLKKH